MGTAGAQRPKGTRRGGFQPPEKPSSSWGEGVAAYAATDERAILRPPLAAGRNPQKHFKMCIRDSCGTPSFTACPLSAMPDST